MNSRFDYRIIISKKLQRQLFATLKNLGTSQRKLASKLGVSRSGVKHWANGDSYIPETAFNKIIEIYPEIEKFENYVRETRPWNWGLVKGGKMRSKIEPRLTNKDRIKGFRKANARTFKRLIKGPNGEKMYNLGEQKIAQYLFQRKLPYLYEPSIRIGQTYKIPDFFANGFIIERAGYSDWDTYWLSFTRKLEFFSENFRRKTIVIVPSKNMDFVRKILKPYKNVILLNEDRLDNLKKILGPPQLKLGP